MQPQGQHMRSIILAVIAAFIALPSVADAQSNYPEKNIRLIYGFPPGSDIFARLFADKLAEAFGKPVIVDNVIGAAGNIAADRTAKAAPDGYSIGMLHAASIVINVSLYSRLPYDPMKDLVPVTQVFGFPLLLVTANDVPAKNVAELVALARTQPGKLTYGHNGLGTVGHLTAEVFKSAAHIDVQDVPYRGVAQMIPDLVSGRISMTFNSPSLTLPLVREEKIRGLAVTSRTRAPFAPNLPTMEESGFRGFESDTWFGLFVPAGTPSSIVEKLNRETAKIMSSPDVSKRITDLGMVPLRNTPPEFAGVIKAETAYWARVIKDAAISPIE
jgi:tripartite-type tricarboxylate transporter receptor subunit TctC